MLKLTTAGFTSAIVAAESFIDFSSETILTIGILSKMGTLNSIGAYLQLRKSLRL